MEPLVQIAYTSTATRLLPANAIRNILAVSRTNNALHGITGMLLYKSGCVLQILEGAPEEVFRLYENLLNDPRHHRLTLLYETALTHRHFPGWSMGFQALEDLNPLECEGTTDGLDWPHRFEGVLEGRARRFLKVFAETVR